MPLIDLVGQRFGRLVVAYRNGSDGRGESLWHCVCDCGTEIDALSSNIRSGHTKSCGCLRVDVSTAMLTKHGLNNERLYSIWHDMKRRCFDPNRPFFDRYGGRGIRVCNEWLDFMAFYAWAKENGYEDHLTLDRIDNDGDYCPSNCRWIPKQEQALNTSQTTFITHDGKTLPLTTWAKMMDLKPATLRYRINNGWSIKDALEIPAGSMKSQGPIKASIYLSYNGETKSLKEWARELNIEYTTLYNRHKIKDWSAQRTLETPVRGNRNASFANKPAHI